MSDHDSPARSVRDLPPTIFAIVMATGIVALAVSAAGWRPGGLALFWVAASAYVALWALTAVRCARHWAAVRADFASHARAPGFFTLVAATGVLGSGCVRLYALPGPGLVLWAVALALWAVLTYAMLPGLMEAAEKPALEEGLSGVWLLAAVATQSVCVLGCQVAPHLSDAAGPVTFAALCFWLAGGVLYLWLIALIFYRVLFRPLGASDLNPTYWINMGAAAISALGGVCLVGASGGSELLAGLAPFLKGLTLMFWATATWWLPLLLALGVWRHGVKRYPLAYDHAYWGAVFPVGMYAVCTAGLGREFGLPFLVPVGEVAAWAALGAWAVTAVGLVRRLAAPTKARR